MHADDDEGRENLCRYILRHPLVRTFGVLSSASRWREHVVPMPDEAEAEQPQRSKPRGKTIDAADTLAAAGTRARQAEPEPASHRGCVGAAEPTPCSRARPPLSRRGVRLHLDPAQAALVQNTRHPDYVRVLCGSLDDLSDAFAELDGVAVDGATPLVRDHRDHRDHRLHRRIKRLVKGSATEPEHAAPAA